MPAPRKKTGARSRSAAIRNGKPASSPGRAKAPVSDAELLAAFWREPVERVVLPNGLTVILKPDRAAALASVQVWVRTGSQHESTHLGSGLSHYLEHMLFKGTARRAGREISSTVQAHGGYINAYTTFDRTVYYIDLPSREVETALDVLADAVFSSSLPAEEVTRERDVILREIAMTRDDPDNRFWEYLFAAAFREHPYRHPIIGYRDAFSAVTRDELLHYYRTRYVPNNAVVVVVGDIDVDATRASVERLFGAIPRAALEPVFIPFEPLPLARREAHYFEEVELTRGALAWHIPGLAHADAPALDLLGMVLGSGDSSILWQAIREKAGLVHSIDAQAWNPGSVGLFCITFTCDAGRRAEAAAAIERVLAEGARRGFTAKQLAKARRQVVVGEINTRKTMAGQASRLGAAEVVVGDLGYARAYFEKLAAVDSRALQRMIREHLVSSRTIELSLNPQAAAAEARRRAPRSAAKPEEFEEIRLRNGARLLLQSDARLPNLHLRLLCLGGVAQEQPGHRGASGLLATMLTKDTRRLSAEAVARTIEEVGGSLHSFAGGNSMGLSAEVLPPDAARAVRLLRDAVLEPAFRQETFAREREAQLAELKQDRDDVVTLGRKLVRRKFFGAHPLALDAHGDEAGVEALAPADLAALHRRLWVAPNLVMAVAGDFRRSDLVPRLRDFLEELPGGNGLDPAAPGGWVPPAGAVHEERQPREQAVVFQAFPGPRLLEADYYVGEVADELFSGMASHLFERVREQKGLAYFVRSARVTGLDAAMFYFYAGAAPAQAAEVLHEIEAEIVRVRDGGVTDAELHRCQVRLQAARQQSLQTNSARAFQAGLSVLYGLPVDDWKRYDARVAAVTRQDLARFAGQYLDPARRIQLVVAP